MPVYSQAAGSVTQVCREGCCELLVLVIVVGNAALAYKDEVYNTS